MNLFILFGISVILASVFASTRTLSLENINETAYNQNVDENSAAPAVAPRKRKSTATLKITRHSLPVDTLIRIATFLRNPHYLLKCLNIVMSIRFVSEITFQKVLYLRYGLPLPPNSDSSELIWFLRPPQYNPDDSLVMRHFVESVAIALTHCNARR